MGSVLAVTGAKLTEAELKNLSMLITAAAGTINNDDKTVDYTEHSAQEIMETLLKIHSSQVRPRCEMGGWENEFSLIKSGGFPAGTSGPLPKTLATLRRYLGHT